MNFQEIGQAAQEQFYNVSKLKVGTLTGLSRDDGHYLVTVEALERKGIPDTMDILGIYEIRMDTDGKMVGFERKRLRKRGQTEAN